MGFVEHSLDGIAILLWAADPARPEKLATPFFHATAAAAMDARVEMYFTATSVHLLMPGVADGLRASPLVNKTIGDNLREAAALGARFFVCSDALHAQGLEASRLIAECSGHGGAVQFMARALDARWRALVF
ncbi:MAG: DsrE family protein [Pseudomonadota bacterium]|nr:DsrE family protein [Pseudomonadota bacterium]